MSASGPSKVVVLDPDARARRQVQLGFEREGIQTVVPAIPADLTKLELGLPNGDIPALALVGGSAGAAIDLIKRARELLVAGNADVPIVFTGHGSRAELLAAGADAVLAHPVYLRDVVTIGRILRNVTHDRRDHLVGSLAETTGVYTLVRALCALGRSAVLTLVRGLRRGEIRFYRGEVTSAQVGLIHGQAAFHQLLLWTDARFDFAYEDIVRRAQIPMTPEELFKDAERFLEGVRESAELLSPSMVLEQDQQRVQGLGKQIPTEVYGVLRMFDGHRVLADILEDSPYRVFETLRVAQKALEIGLLRQIAESRPKPSWRAVLAIEEWLVGSETRDQVVERTSVIDSGPVSRQSKPKFKKGKRGKKTRTPPTGTPIVKSATDAKPDEIDWVSLVPRSIGAEVGQLAGVVPAAAAHGEIDVASRDKAREKLEALMDTGKRDRIFPTEIGIEPSVVVREEGDDWEAKEWSAKTKIDGDAKVKQELSDADTDKPGQPTADAKAKADADAKAKADADAKAKADADVKLKADADAKADAEAKLKADADVEAKAKADADAKAKADADVEAKAKADADAKAKADADAKAKADADAKAKADADATAKADADATAKADADAKVKADADAKAKADADAKADAEAARFRDDAQARVRESVEKMRIDRALKDEADQRELAQTTRKNAAEEAKVYAARVKAAADVKRIEAESAARGDLAAASMIATPIAEPVGHADRGSTRVIITAPVLVSETSTATVTVADTMTVVGAADTATITTTPQVLVREQPRAGSVKPTNRELTELEASVTPTADAPPAGTPNPTATIVEITPRPRRAGPEHDGPPVKQTTGEISKSFKPQAEVTQGPSILIEPEPEPVKPAVLAAKPSVPSALDSKFDRSGDADVGESADEVATTAFVRAEPERDAPGADAVVAKLTAEPVAAKPAEPKPEPKPEPTAAEQSALVADLAAAHAAIAAATSKASGAPAAPSKGDAATSSREMIVSQIRKDAVEFTVDEEAFFNAKENHTAAAPKLESFDDLDEGYEPPKFWDRVFGRKKKPH